MEDTGIALFVYNRPEHTERVLEGLRQNGIEELYIFADGPRPDDDENKIKNVREMISSIEWCQTHVVEREQNWGLAESTIAGINRVFKDNERLIMLEDDDVPHPDFIQFMNRCLDIYANDLRVMNVTGYSPPIDIPETYPYDVYFTHRASSWGWGTWKDAWKAYERQPDTLMEQFQLDESTVRERLRKGGEDVFHMLRSRLNGENDSWSIWWTVAILLQGGLSVNPIHPYIKNIGHDGTGTHSIETHIYDVNIEDAKQVSELQLPEQPFVHETLNDRMNHFWNPDISTRAKRKFGRIIRRI